MKEVEGNCTMLENKCEETQCYLYFLNYVLNFSRNVLRMD